jgi:cytochrome oxidase assembly protein ShyY1
MNRTIATVLKLTALLAALSVLLSLSWWQYHRGRQKQALADVYAQALHAEPAPLTAALAATQTPRMQPVRAHGVYLADRQLLLDNQVHAEQPGFDAWTPLRSDDGALIIVDRGWIPLAQRDSVASPPSGPIDVRGFWRTLPAPALRLSADNCAAAAWPRVVEFPTAADLTCLLGEAPVAGVVDLDPQLPGGFVRDWTPNQGFPPERHFGYAAQWFALAVTLAVLSIRFMLKHR